MPLKFIIVLIIFVVFAIICIAVKVHKESTERMYRAAGNILKNEFLDHMLLNPMLNGNNLKAPGGSRPMVYFRLLRSKPAKEYVFDPKNEVGIGRSRDKNSIVLSEAIVSLEHCKVFISGGLVCLEDLGSSNGTIVKRGFHSYLITSGQQIVLENKDTLIVGTVELKLKIFDYDMVWM